MNKVIYKDVAVGSKSNPPTIMTAGSGLLVGTEPSNAFKDIVPVDYVTFENNGFDLTRTDQIFAQNLSSLGLISASVSDSSGVISCGFTASAQNGAVFTSPGVTIRFHQNYCKSGTMVFRNGSTIVASISFVCNQLVNYIPIQANNYKSISFTFTSTENPYQFVKIASIDLGREVVLTDLYNMTLLEEINLAGDDLSINAFDFSCEADENLNIQEDQLFYAYNNDTLLGKFNMDDVTENTFTRYTMNCSDDITLLDKVNFNGGIYYPQGSYNPTVKLLLNQIMSLAHVNIEYDNSYATVGLKGWIPFCSCRKALMLIAFAIGAVVHTGRDGTISMRPFNENQTPIIIPESRILGNAKYSKGDIYTGVELARYDYTWTTGNLQTIYKTDSTPLTSPVTIYHSMPMGAYTYSGTVSYTTYANYVVINSMGANAEVKGYPFIETKTILSKNKNTYNAGTNVKSFNDYTLYSSFNKLNQLYHLTVEYGGTVNATIILGGEQVGDIVSIPTKYSGTKIGVIISLDSNVNNHLVAKAVIKCLG